MTRVRGRFVCVGFGAVIALAPAAAFAQTVRLDEGPVTPRMMALGGRAEALSSSTSSMFGNPAAMGLTHSYHGDTYGMFDATTNAYGFGTALVDSTRTTITAGTSYFYTHVDTATDHREVHDWRIALSLPIGTAFGIGVTGRYLDANGGPTLTNSNMMSVLQPLAYNGFTVDAGMFLRPINQLQFTVTGYNLNNPQTTVAPLAMGAGVAFLPIPELTFVADGYMDFMTFATPRGRYSGGVELFIANRVPIRAGYAYDDIRGGAQAVTAGLGYLDENFGVEVGLRQGIVPEPQTTLMLSLRFFYRPGQ